ncbi:MAG: hypothetical protein EA381_00050, partial [Planctomycetaceae bacterium]
MADISERPTMDARCLEHVLTDEEREFFNTQGYLTVENALEPEATDRLIKVVDRIDERERIHDRRGTLMSFANIIHEDDAFVDLLDLPATLPKVWGVLGWNIYLYHSHLDITPPAGARPADIPNCKTWSVAWHQDSMRVNDEIEVDPRPRLSVKVGFYLTDV